jgi:hypothetical protein
MTCRPCHPSVGTDLIHTVCPETCERWYCSSSSPPTSSPNTSAQVFSLQGRVLFKPEQSTHSMLRQCIGLFSSARNCVRVSGHCDLPEELITPWECSGSALCKRMGLVSGGKDALSGVDCFDGSGMISREICAHISPRSPSVGRAGGAYRGALEAASEVRVHFPCLR